MPRIVARKKLVTLPEQVWKSLKEQGYDIPENDYDLKRVNFKQYLKKLSIPAKRTLARILLGDLGMDLSKMLSDCEHDGNAILLHSIMNNQKEEIIPIEVE